MAEFMKKLSVGSYFNIVAAVLGIVGLVAAAICSGMTVTYSLGNMGTIVVLALVGALLALASVYLPTILGNANIPGTLTVLLAIASFAAAFGNVLSERILLIAGLFSYDSVNTVGWQVFYVTVVAMAAFLVGCLVLIIGAFMNSVKAE